MPWESALGRGLNLVNDSNMEGRPSGQWNYGPSPKEPGLYKVKLLDKQIKMNNFDGTNWEFYPEYVIAWWQDFKCS